MENTLFHSHFFWAISSSISQHSNHGGIAGFHLRRQSLNDPPLPGSQQRKKRTRNRSSPVQTIFLASIISSFPVPAYRKFRYVDPFPAFNACCKSSNSCSPALFGDSFLNPGMEFTPGKKCAWNSLM